MNIGPSLPMQQLQRWISAGRGRQPGPRLTVEDLKRRYTRSVPDPYGGILDEDDSLLLSAAQRKAIEGAQSRYQKSVDSLWAPLTEYLAGLGDSFDAREALRRQETATDEVWEFTRLDIQRTLPSILSSIQTKLLPWPAGMLLAATKPVRIRMFM